MIIILIYFRGGFSFLSLIKYMADKLILNYYNGIFQFYLFTVDIHRYVGNCYEIIINYVI